MPGTCDSGPGEKPDSSIALSPVLSVAKGCHGHPSPIATRHSEKQPSECATMKRCGNKIARGVSKPRRNPSTHQGLESFAAEPFCPLTPPYQIRAPATYKAKNRRRRLSPRILAVSRGKMESPVPQCFRHLRKECIMIPHPRCAAALGPSFRPRVFRRADAAVVGGTKRVNAPFQPLSMYPVAFATKNRFAARESCALAPAQPKLETIGTSGAELRRTSLAPFSALPGNRVMVRSRSSNRASIPADCLYPSA